jgi:hypothetical protein
MNWSTAASLATALATLVLAVATFVAVRAANRSARVAEYSMQIGIRPLLVPSRLEDPVQKLMWPDEHWVSLPGAGASIEDADDGILMAMSVRNSGSGIAVIQGWHLILSGITNPAQHHAEPDAFRRQIRDLYVSGSDIGFWQGAVRDKKDPEYESLGQIVRERRLFGIEILYSDHEGGQRAVSRFSLSPTDDGWACSVVRHWNIDRPDPRD